MPSLTVRVSCHLILNLAWGFTLFVCQGSMFCSFGHLGCHMTAPWGGLV